MEMKFRGQTAFDWWVYKLEQIGGHPQSTRTAGEGEELEQGSLSF